VVVVVGVGVGESQVSQGTGCWRRGMGVCMADMSRCLVLVLGACGRKFKAQVERRIQQS
jgi:hypothetical protein